MTDYTQFLSTLPARGATQKAAGRPAQRYISIHAPREGSDPRRNGWKPSGPEFLSTLPARGATNSLYRDNWVVQFLSTLPARGATGID